jgi:hypothetical protein
MKTIPKFHDWKQRLNEKARIGGLPPTKRNNN